MKRNHSNPDIIFKISRIGASKLICAIEIYTVKDFQAMMVRPINFQCIKKKL